MTDLAIYGSIILQTDVEHAVQAVLEDQLEEYVARMERHTGREKESVAMPESYIKRNELDHWPSENLPSIVVTCPGVDPGSIRKYGDRTYSAKWLVGVGAVVGADTKENADDLAKLYGGAIRECLIQNRSLEGFSEACDWVDGRTDELGSNPDNLNLSGAREVFAVEVHNVLNEQGGLTTPPDDIYEEPGDPDTFLTHKESVSAMTEEDK